MTITNFKSLAKSSLREKALLIAEAGYEAIDIEKVIKKRIKIENHLLKIASHAAILQDSGDNKEQIETNLNDFQRIFIVGIGKGSALASKALAEIFGDRLTGGIALDVNELKNLKTEKLKTFVGTHPLPLEKNIKATQEIIKLAESLNEKDLLITFVCGGGSALACASEQELKESSLIVQKLTKDGADIAEINTIRKHLSEFKGGGLAKIVYPATMISLIVSDVCGNNLSNVASGPTVYDKTTLEDARNILKKYGLNPAGFNLIETPKEELYFKKARNILFVCNQDALDGMMKKAGELGFKAKIHSLALEGEAKSVLAPIAQNIRNNEAVIVAGETTVTLSTDDQRPMTNDKLGKGGRNQEAVLGALARLMTNDLQQITSLVFISFASDSHDNTEAAGAVGDYSTLEKAKELKLKPEEFLNKHDSFNFFDKTGDLIYAGKKCFNVADLMVILKEVNPFIKKLSEVGIEDVAEVGGKNASLGEMIKNLTPKGLKVPGGFVVTAAAYRNFLKNAHISDGKGHIANLEEFIKQSLKGLNTKNLKDLAWRGKAIREKIKSAEFPSDLRQEIVIAYRDMEDECGKNIDVAVRSSATAEDLPGASFAGEHETYLNIRGAAGVLEAVKFAMASLFTDRAISYRVDKGFDHFQVALSVGVQKMVRSDMGCSGVMFTLDTESGFSGVVLVNGSWGLGEMIVQGEVTPDEFLVFKKTGAIIDKKLGVKNRKMIYGSAGSAQAAKIKTTKIINTSLKEKEIFALSEDEIRKLAQWGMIIEEHYSSKNGKWTPMDMEWAKDGKTGELYIVQARPETVHAMRDFTKIKDYKLIDKQLMINDQRPLVKGASVGSKIAVGKARVILDAKNVGQFKAGEVLVTDMTDPDWEPIMKIASAIITDKGGRTSHAAIVSRELGIPCIVGSENATKKIKTGQVITVDVSGSEGFVYNGELKFEVIEHDVKSIPKTKTKIMMNIATPETAFEKSFLLNSGVGLAREEFIIAGDIGIHPMALIEYDKIKIKNKKLKAQIDKKTIGYKDKTQFYVDKLAYGIAKIGAAFYPNPVIVRFSDFKTNEYKTLIGGEFYEPQEENPMIGWRGASRYYHPDFAEAFILEVKAIKKVREEMGLDNVEVMVPFCRTPEEGKKVLEIMEKNGLDRQGGLKIYVMCEIPSNVILADEFLEIFDGMSIGSNDLTQLTVGIDRDGNEMIRAITNENDESVKKLISEIIRKCKEKNKYIGICGQAPSDIEGFAEFLVEQGIESISLNPDTIIKTTLQVYEREKQII